MTALRSRFSNLLKRPHRRKLLRLGLLAALLAAGAALFPAVRCAWGDCSNPDKWCRSDCTTGCAGATSLGVVTGCGAYNFVGGYCPETWSPNSVAADCHNPNDCNVSGVSASYAHRLSTRNGYSYWTAGGCVYDASRPPSFCVMDSDENTGRVDCCGGSGNSGGGGGGRPCTPEYGPPTLALAGHTPGYPLVITQDPDRRGVRVAITASGGADRNGCGGSQAITALSLSGVQLSDASRAWIATYLAERYPGAQVKGRYPFIPEATLSGIGTASAGLQFHFEPLDPGFYQVTATATQEDGQTASATFSLPVYLLDATLTMPEQP